MSLLKGSTWRRLGFDDYAAGLILLMPLFLIIGRAVADGVTFLSTLLFLYHCMQTRDWDWLKTRWVQIGFALWVYLFISGAFALTDPLIGFKRAIIWGRLLLLSAAIVFWYSRRAWWDRALGRMLIATVILVCIDTLVQFIFGISLSGRIKPSYPGRLSGPFNRLIVGIYLAKLFWPALAKVFAETQALPRGAVLLWCKRVLVPLAFIGFTSLIILLSGERMAFLLTGLSLLIFAVCARGFRKPLFACGIPLLVAVVAIVSTQPMIRNRAIDAGHMLTHFQDTGYGVIFNNALIAWKQSPIMGVGPKNFVALCAERGTELGYRDAIPESPNTFECARHPHNPYLEWMTDTGLIGLSLFVLLVFVWTRDAARAVWQQRFEAAHVYLPQLALAVGLLPFLWPLQGNMSIFTNWNAILFWWTIGVILAGLQRTPTVIQATENPSLAATGR